MAEISVEIEIDKIRSSGVRFFREYEMMTGRHHDEQETGCDRDTMNTRVLS